MTALYKTKIQETTGKSYLFLVFVLYSFNNVDHFSFLDDVMKEMKIDFHISEDVEIRLWNRYMSNTYELLTNTASTIQDAGLYDSQVSCFF